MTIKCRLCGVSLGPIPDDDMSKLFDVMAEHLLRTGGHKWELLKYISGQEGDGSIERMMHSLAFEGADSIHSSRPQSLKAFIAIQQQLLSGATQPSAITGNKKA